jgi:hypothetical protein
MFPARRTSFPAARSIAARRDAVVDLPLVPVTAATVPRISRNPSSSSPQTGMPRLRASESIGTSTLTPGLGTTRSTPETSEVG